MNGGEITGNTASSSSYDSSSSGGGVYVGGGTFAMSDGEITGNTATSSDSGVSVGDGTFIMSGGARVNVNNPVCLYYSSSITIEGDLSGATVSVARIDLYADNATPWSSWIDRRVITSGYIGDLTALGSRFTLGNFIGQTGSSGNYKYPTWPITGYINADGNLAAIAP
jgi:hypothetical protein